MSNTNSVEQSLIRQCAELITSDSTNKLAIARLFIKICSFVAYARRINALQVFCDTCQSLKIRDWQAGLQYIFPACLQFVTVEKAKLVTVINQDQFHADFTAWKRQHKTFFAAIAAAQDERKQARALASKAKSDLLKTLPIAQVAEIISGLLAKEANKYDQADFFEYLQNAIREYRG